MRYDPKIHQRRSIRLTDYDYSNAGVYFVTVCTHDHECLFGDVSADGTMVLSAAGDVVANEWAAAVAAYAGAECDAYVVMPNHFHGIVIFNDTVGAIRESPLHPPMQQRRTMGLSRLVGRFKTRSAKRINPLRGTPGASVWQRNCYERIIRNDAERDRIRDYIQNNPARWADDAENPFRP